MFFGTAYAKLSNIWQFFKKAHNFILLLVVKNKEQIVARGLFIGVLYIFAFACLMCDAK